VQGNATDAILALLRLGADPNYKNGANPRSTTKGEGAYRGTSIIGKYLPEGPYSMPRAL